MVKTGKVLRAPDPRHIGIYPGTFDPITFGHLDIIQRASRLLDRLIIAVAANEKKEPLFALEERTEMIQGELSSLAFLEGVEVTVKPFKSLLVDFAREEGAQILIRGLRPVSDFDYEFQMAGTNRKLNPNLETVFLMASEANQLIASNLVREIARLQGNTSHFVSSHVGKKLKDHFIR